MEYLQEYKWMYIVAQVTGILILWATLKSNRLGRFLFALLFAGACYTNLTLASKTPEVYLNYSPMALRPYSDFIEGWFKDHITLMVPAIAVGQGLIAIAILLNKWWVKTACIASVIFLIAIAPLGVGSAFPFSITLSVAAFFIFKNENHDFIWKTDQYLLKY